MNCLKNLSFKYYFFIIFKNIQVNIIITFLYSHNNQIFLKDLNDMFMCNGAYYCY